MTVYHIGQFLFKLKSGTPQEKVDDLEKTAKAMVGQVPGLQRLDFGGPLASTAHRAQGFNMGLVAVLDKAEDVKVYAEHPAHQKVHAIREGICDDTLAYDLEF